MGFTRIVQKSSRHGTGLRNFIFGVEDSLVSTVGLLAGIATADLTRSAIITTGFVLIVVEGLSMGIGSFLTQETTDEMSGAGRETSKSLTGGIIMLFSYCLAGLVPLAPYAFFPGDSAVYVSVIASLVGLFLLGSGTSMYYMRPKPWMHGFKMLFLGGIAVAVGMVVGKVLRLRVQ